MSLETTVFTFKISVPFEEWAAVYDSEENIEMNKERGIVCLYEVTLLSAQILFFWHQLFISFIMNLRQEKLKNGGKQLMRQCHQVVDGMMR